MSTYTFNGVEYDSADLTGSNGRGYGAEDTPAGTGDIAPLYIRPMIDAMADMANGKVSTSTTSLALSVSSGNVLTLASVIPIVDGMKCQIIDRDAPTTNYAWGTVTGWNSSSKVVTFDIDAIQGSGTLSNWDFVGAVGRRGDTGGGLADVVDDTSPQLGGALDVNGKAIVSASNGDIDIVPNGTGKVNFQDKNIQRGTYMDSAEVKTSPSSSSGTLILDMALGNVFEVTLTEAVTTITFSNFPTTGSEGWAKVIFIQDGTGGWAITFPAAVDFAGGTPPSLTTAAGTKSSLMFTSSDAGTIIDGYLLGDALA